MKRILAFILIGLVLFGGVLLAADPAKMTLVASIGEVPANSGIRIVEGTGVSGAIDGATFDPVFFSAPSEIQMSTGVDTAVSAASGSFTIMVRRPTVAGFTVTVSGTPLKLSSDSTKFLAYTIKDVSTPYAIIFVSRIKTSSTATEVNGITYSGTASASSILRHQKTFTYNVPKDTTSPLGIYSADITFTLTTT